MAQPPPLWPLFDLAIFDCDSTLSTIEGIDELAQRVEAESGPGDRDRVAATIASLTKRAMEGDLPLEAVYGRRLGTLNPTQAQVRHIARRYRETVVPGTRGLIAALQELGVKVFIVSGGLIEPVRDFGIWLGVPGERIFAVDMEYDQLAGAWWRYWEQPGGANPQANYLAVENSPLTGALGKNRVIQRLRAEHRGRALLVGDGLSDLEAASEVDLFVGFGGAAYRPRVADGSPVYIHARTLAPVLPLALGQRGNVPQYARLWAEGLQRVYDGQVHFRDPAQRDAFLASMRRAANGASSP